MHALQIWWTAVLFPPWFPQNFDGLEVRAGIPADKVYPLHGSLDGGSRWAIEEDEVVPHTFYAVMKAQTEAGGITMEFSESCKAGVRYETQKLRSVRGVRFLPANEFKWDRRLSITEG